MLVIPVSPDGMQVIPPVTWRAWLPLGNLDLPSRSPLQRLEAARAGLQLSTKPRPPP